MEGDAFVEALVAVDGQEGVYRIGKRCYIGAWCSIAIAWIISCRRHVERCLFPSSAQATLPGKPAGRW